MTDVGLWIHAADGKTFLIKKDSNGYPDLIPLHDDASFDGIKAKKEKGKTLYEDLTGTKYPLPNATTRQVLWDFLEVAIQRLP